MGIIKAVFAAAGGSLADQWLEAIEPDDMGGQTVFVKGVQVRRGKFFCSTLSTSRTLVAPM